MLCFMEIACGLSFMKLGFGMLAFINDGIYHSNSLSPKAFLEEDGYDYSAIGCVETAVPGKWGYCTGMSYKELP